MTIMRDIDDAFTNSALVGFELYRIFIPLSRVRILIPCLDWNKIVLPGQLPLSHKYYFLRLRQEFLAPLYFYLLGRDNTSCTKLQQKKKDMTLNPGIIYVAPHPIVPIDS